MRTAQEPLTESEVAHLRHMLEATGARSLEYARGVFTATATSPASSAPTDWLPMLLGPEIPSKEALSETFGLLMREYNSVCDCLNLGVPVVPAASEARLIRDFCQGYIRVVQKSARWKLDQEAFARLLPLAVLSEYVKGESLENLAPDFAAAPAEWAERQRTELTETLVHAHAYWESARKEAPPEENKATTGSEPESASPLLVAARVGRNDPCPCKSGKKYKKCCGAPS